MISINNLDMFHQRVKSIKNQEVLLRKTLGKEKFERIVDTISKTIKLELLDTTPTILKDIFDYLIKINLRI
ncbi:hypothetical protein DP145_01690 [Clostridium tetani]|uniref:hypothetical protein n=1 Tax=Clostridium tetani TaxID=1513 RepID=UPI00100BED81|nr:hypothetical protein [Clostridium tetani]RXI46077.1 hypothetical protein DP126_07770 [Clostridium tetani]RXM61469.1 hypothetical protein DP138_04605 [Clostridium tetani]RXM70294.1 hypothetical protein DP145_01690 [Clostridium tetani]BDR73345.1 hypothetical protein K144316041_20530 [Clostridium tetani]